MKLLRLVVVVAVLAYAGWLGWPFVSPLIEGAAPATTALQAGGGEALFGFLPVWTLWIAAIGMYVIAALMLGGGDSRAVGAYFLGFLADAGLRLALERQGGGAAASGPATMATPEALSSLPVEPLWLLLGGLALLGVLVMVAARRIRRTRTPGQLAY
ncbi:MAG: hypothetical protein HYU62_01545 [Caulobacterales bacterium]|nr:hypothetical protein [Caulobacterales bacterium]